MTNSRRFARNLAFQALFELDSRPDMSVDGVLESRVIAHQEDSGETVGARAAKFAGTLLRGTMDHRDEIDQRIHVAAPAFPVEQLPLTDRVALELAVYELTYTPDTPAGAVINEAVELAKTYGGENSGRFVNGVLGTIAGERREGRPSRGRP